MYLPVPGLLLIIVALIAGCAPLPPAAPGASSQAATTAQSPPSWRSADELVDFGSQTPPVAASDLDLRLDGSDALRMRLAGRCARSATGSAAGDLGDAFVRELVADLYAGGVDPGVASEAMISAGCGEADVIVRELVAQGGDTAALPVVDRAVAAQGPAAFDAMEQAAAEGLRRWRRATGLEAARISAPLAGADLSYSMIYFPFGGRGDPVERFSSPAQVFGSASPVYGIYTFILHGDLDADTAPANIDIYRELLRVIETYVLASEGGNSGGNGDAGRQAHGFLVPVHAQRSGATLLERTGPELSAGMRGDFAAYLRAGGQLELAQRLNRAAGPFLVSSLEPRLVPADPRVPRMLVDLSDIGPEYMYSVVDAYDRPIPADQVGSVESLAAIRARLIDMFPDTAIDASATPPPAGGWVYLFGRRQDAKVRSRAARSAPLMLAETDPEGRDGNLEATP